MKHCVYLAGPISGLTYDGAQDWRDQVRQELDSSNIETLTPMRGKTFLKEEGVITSAAYENVIATSKGVTRRDFFDCTRASCVFVNLLGAKRVSIGTVMEIAWAYQAKIPTVVLMEKGNIHEHIMIEEACHYVVDSVDKGVALVRFLLNEVKK